MAAEKQVLKVKLTLTERMLGTAPKNQEIYAKYIATKAPVKENGEQEVVDVKEIEKGGWTGFLTDVDGIYIPDYMIRGNLKNNIENLIATGQVEKIPAYKKWLDEICFVFPRKIHIGKHEPDGVVERSLRAITPQGPRVFLQRSDYLDAGTEFQCEIHLFKNSKKLTLDVIKAALDYGQYIGFGQWRGSGGYGRYTWGETK